MPTVLDAPMAQPLDRKLARAAGRIRMTDVWTGLLAVLVFTLAYASVVIAIDRWLNLPGPARQFGFLLWVLGTLVLSYRLIVRPFTQAINPLFVAKKVESAIPDAKNVVVNYVDLQDRDLPESVRMAVTKQAANEVTDQDVTKAGESRTIPRLAITAITLVVVLASFFLLFSPAQFSSLVKRAFTPFATQAIVSKTRIEILLPTDPNATITSGTPLIFSVSLEGRLPKPDGEDRTRLLLRHNPDDPNDEIVPFESGASNREFQLKVPDYLIQNGFWYRIASGDAETQQYRVTVRPRLLVTGVRVAYEYPKYLRIPADSADHPHIEAYRGTVVTVTATANRAVASGRVIFDGKPDAITGQTVPETADKIRFQFPITESGIYRIILRTADGESTIDPPAYPIKVLTDNPPTVRIEKPETAEVTLPLNGLLELDAVADDDLGLAKVVTKLKKAGENQPVIFEKPYRISLKREADGSFPTRVEIKESIKLVDIKDLKEGDVLECWIEATDHCELPEGQVGKSAVKLIRLTAIPPEPEKKTEQEKKIENRQNEQKQHDQKQQQKFDNENRQPPKGQQDRNPDGNKQENNDNKTEQGNPGQSQDGAKPMGGDQSKDPMQNPMGSSDSKPMSGNETKDPMQKPDGSKPMTGNEINDPMQNPMPGSETKDPMQKPMGSNPGQNEQPKPGQQNQSGTSQSNQNQQTGNAGEPQKSNPMGGGTDANPQKSDAGIDPKQQEKIENQANRVNQELGNNKPQQSQQGNGQKDLSPEQKQQLQNAAKDLNSSDPDKRKQAEQTIDNMIGKDNREAAQKKAEQLKKDLQSGDPAKQEAAKKEIEKMAEEAKKQNGGQPQQGGNGEMSPEQKQKFEKAAQDMASSDPKRQAAGEKAMDEMIGKSNREAAQKQAEQIKKDLQSDDPKTRDAAQKKLQEMADQANKQNGGPGTTPEQKQDLAKAGEGMKSSDPMQKGNAEQKIDNALGQNQNKADDAKANQAKEDLKSGNGQAKADAQKQLEKMAQANQKGQPGENKPGQGMSEKEKQDLANAARDLNSPDPAKRAAAEKEIDKQIGSDARKQAQKDAEQLKKDLQSNDKATRDAAQKKVEDLAKQMNSDGKPGEEPNKTDANQQPKTGDDPNKTASKPPSAEDLKKMREAAKSLNSDNPDEKKAAQKTLDDMIGEKNRKETEQMASDLKSNDPQTRKAAEQKLKDMAQQANNQKGNGQQPKPSEEDMRKAQEKMAETAKNLTSKDDAKRQQAEKELDDQIGQKNREQIQQAMNDMQSGDPQRQQEGQKKLDDMMKQAQQNAGKFNKDWRPGGMGGGEKGGPALEDNPLDRLKTAELQLKTFKENRTNKDLLKKLEMNEQEYDEFLKGYEKLVEAERKRIAVAAKAGTNPDGTPKAMNVNRGGEKLGSRTTDGDGPKGASAGTAPPGYSDATRKFAEEAAKKGQNPK